MKHLKYFEKIENEIVDKGPYFVNMDDIIIGKNKYFIFIYDIERDVDKKRYLAKYINFSYKDMFNEINIENTFDNSYFEMKKLELDKFITPDEFFNQNENICILLYEQLNKWLLEYDNLNKHNKKL